MFRKKADVAIVIPTFNAAETTITLLKRLESQRNIVFDVILIDAGKSTDYKQISKVKTKLNILIKHLKFDNGSAGSFYYGEKIAYEMGYEYIILDDNDAVPISKKLIYELVKNCTPEIATVPSNILIHKKNQNTILIKQFSFHFLTLHKGMIKRIGYIREDLFTFGDDAEYTRRISSTFKLERLGNVFYKHRAGIDIFLIELLRFRPLYYGIRNNILIANGIRNKLAIAVSYLFIFFPIILKTNKEQFGRLNYVILKGIFDGIIGKTGRAAIKAYKTSNGICSIKLVRAQNGALSNRKGYFIIGKNRKGYIQNYQLLRLFLSRRKIVVDNKVESIISYRILPFLLVSRLYIIKNKVIYKTFIGCINN